MTMERVSLPGPEDSSRPQRGCKKRDRTGQDCEGGPGDHEPGSRDTGAGRPPAMLGVKRAPD